MRPGCAAQAINTLAHPARSSPVLLCGGMVKLRFRVCALPFVFEGGIRSSSS